MTDNESEQYANQESEEQENKPKLLRTWLRENTGGWWIGFVLEAGLIVFSVLLALAVNEWRAERARAQKAQTALEAIHSELEANREVQCCYERAQGFHRYVTILSRARVKTSYEIIRTRYF